MINDAQIQDVVGSTAYSSDGSKIGKVGQVFLDDQSGRPEFVTVNTGLFGNKESYVPVTDATFEGDRLTLPYPKDRIKDAPQVDLDGNHLDAAEEQRLYEHYGLTWTSSDAGSGYDAGQGTGHDAGVGTGVGTGEVGHDTSGPTTDSAMTRSEERVEVGTTQREAGRARLRKYVTTETETRTVPVRSEHAVVEREPITDGNVGDALDGPEISEEEHEVVLHAEEPVVTKTTEPVERVRLGTETTVTEETVTEDVRKENIEVEGDADDVQR